MGWWKDYHILGMSLEFSRITVATTISAWFYLQILAYNVA